VSSIRVLVVEDEGPKRSHIHDFLKTLSPKILVVTAASVNSALDVLDEVAPDLMLLDMSLPTFDVSDRESGGRPQGFGGIEILRQMVLSDIRCPTIVITGYEAFQQEAGQPVELSKMRSDLTKEFPDLFLGVLHYNSTFDQWKWELKEILSLNHIFDESERQ